MKHVSRKRRRKMDRILRRKKGILAIYCKQVTNHHVAD